MPANLTQQYHAAEEAYKKASTPEENWQLLKRCLRRFQSTWGTEKLQADIKSAFRACGKKAVKLKAAAAARKILLLSLRSGPGLVAGTPNSGKSAPGPMPDQCKTQVAEYPCYCFYRCRG